MPFDYWFKPTKAIKTQDGSKAQSQRGAFAKNWWAQRWIAALERLVDSGRRSHRRSYARQGQVLFIEETKDGITARVQGSMQTPYKIKIQITKLTNAEWDKVMDALAEQAIFAAQLLAAKCRKTSSRCSSGHGVEAPLREAYQTIGRKAIQVAFQEQKSPKAGRLG